MMKIADIQTSLVPPTDVGFTYTPKENWDAYNLHTYNVLHQGKPTDLQAIVYKGNFIAFRSKNYHVFPHEDIFHEIDPIMDIMNGEPFHEHIRREERFELVYGNNKRIAVEADFKVHGGKRTHYGAQIRSTYLFKDEKFDVTGDGQNKVTFGATIGNTIDGGGSLYISPYSLREVCTNGMMHRATVAEISENIIAKMMKNKEGLGDITALQEHLKTIMEESRGFDDLITRIKKERMSHLSKIPVEWISSRIYLIKESISTFKQRYRQMTEMLITQEQAEKLVNSMPKRLIDELKWLDVKEDVKEIKTPDGKIDHLQQVVQFKGAVPSQWSAFNDITYNLTHESRSFKSVEKRYKSLDQILVMATK